MVTAKWTVMSLARAGRAAMVGGLAWKTRLGLIVVPVLVMGPLTWAFWSPQANHNTARAAVVNNDEPVTVNGQIIPLGRLLAGNLTHSADSAYTWVLTDAGDAASGLADGTYVAAVTIPRDFSARATSSASGRPLEATRAQVSVHTSQAAGILDPAASAQVVRATQQALNQRIVKTYLDNIYIAFSTIHGQINQAADGSGQLADGTGRLLTGATQLADGAGQLATALGQLSGGADQLAAGTAQLASGSSQLAAGLTQAATDTRDLPALTRQLADGARQVADGNEQLADLVVPLANRMITIIDAFPSSGDATAELRELIDQCEHHGGSTGFCQDLSTALDHLMECSDTIDSARATLRQAAVDIRDTIQALADGANQVADGTERLANAAGALTDGIASAASGATQLNAGVQQVNSGATQLADGADRLAGETTRFVDGATQLNAGVQQVNSGATELATQLDQGRDKVPTYSEAERDHLSSVAAHPTDGTTSRSSLGTAALSLFVALALWACALATYLVVRAVPSAVQTSRAAPWRILLSATRPGVTTAITAALVLSALVLPVLGLDVARSAAFTATCVLAALAFAALNQAAIAVFRLPGRLAALAVLVLAMATGVVSTVPGPLEGIDSYLPPHAAALVLNAIATGSGGAPTGIASLAAWLAIGGLATTVSIARHRYLSGRQLRPGLCRPAGTGPYVPMCE
ncbi:MAG: YhgE/Pip family protein [Micromonosporaceae bacterium]|nr:YhgE/Pip family protein [Micromonosporaceae bacterium]